MNPFMFLLNGLLGMLDYMLGFLVDVLAAVLLLIVEVIVEIAKFLIRSLPNMPAGGSSASLVLDYAGDYIPVAVIATAFGLWLTFYQLLGSAQIIKFIRGA